MFWTTGFLNEKRVQFFVSKIFEQLNFYQTLVDNYLFINT